MLGLLAALGVFARDDAGFSLTIIGDGLRTDAPAGFRSWATFPARFFVSPGFTPENRTRPAPSLAGARHVGHAVTA